MRDFLVISSRVTFRPLKVIQDHWFRYQSKAYMRLPTSTVRHSNLGPILHRFGDIAGFWAPDPTPIPPHFGGSFPLDKIAHVGVIPSIYLRLISREITFEVFQPMWSWYPNVTDGQTNRLTDWLADGQTTYYGITALCVASSGKKQKKPN